MSENEMTPLVAALAALGPRPATLDRDRLMFLAGQRSAARRGWLLPCLSVALASAVTLLGVFLLYHPEPPIVTVPMLPPGPPAPSSFLAETEGAPTPTGDYILLRNRFLMAGVDALPPLPPDQTTGPSPNGILRPHMLPRDDFGILGGSL